MFVAVIALMLGGVPQMEAAKPTPPAPAKPICRRQAETGSIMPGKKTCHTLAQWKEIDAANAKQVDQFRDQANNGRGAN